MNSEGKPSHLYFAATAPQLPITVNQFAEECKAHRD
jgi:hypothetical protein